MILIDNYKVDMPDNVNAKYAVFTVEFEKDNRLYVGHVLNRTVISAVTALILNAFDDFNRFNDSDDTEYSEEWKRDGIQGWRDDHDQSKPHTLCTVV